MTTTLVPPQPTTGPPPTPAPPTRLSLIALAAVVLVGYLVLFASGADLQYDARLGEVRDAYDVSEGVSQLSAYLAMAFVALLFSGQIDPDHDLSETGVFKWTDFEDRMWFIHRMFEQSHTYEGMRTLVERIYDSDGKRRTVARLSDSVQEDLRLVV